MRVWFVIPDAILGFLAYLGDIIFALAGCERRWQYRPWLVLLFGFDVIPLGFVSALLVFLQGTVVDNWCTLCIVTAIISLAFVVLAIDEGTLDFDLFEKILEENKKHFQILESFLGISLNRNS